jgi:uncharacterized protein (TIGR03067 family)
MQWNHSHHGLPRAGHPVLEATFSIKESHMRLASAMLILSAVGLFSADDAKKDDAESLKGKWSVVSLSTGGQAAEGDLIKDLKMDFDDKTYSVTGSEPFLEEGNYTIDASKSPKTIDFDIKKGQEAGKLQLGLFKIDGTKLTIVVSQAGSKERPTSLKVEPGSMISEIVLEKAKP